MTDTVKLIIEIPKSDYKAICANKEDSIIAHDTCRRIANNGIPLDDVKAEIRDLSFDVTERSSGEQITLNYTVNVLKILDNIGKAESEE